MDDIKDCIMYAIQGIKEHLKTQDDDLIKAGIYMALQTIKDEISDEQLLEVLGLNEEFEKYL